MVRASGWGTLESPSLTEGRRGTERFPWLGVYVPGLWCGGRDPASSTEREMTRAPLNLDEKMVMGAARFELAVFTVSG